MTVLPLLAVGIFMKFVAALFVLVSLVLILIVLMQKGRGGGLSGAFAGGMASGLLGSKTGDFLTWVTVVLVGIFLLLAVLMAKYYRPSISSYGRGQPPASQQPLTGGQPSAPQPGATEQPVPAVPSSAPPSGPAQPLAPASQPGTSGPGAQPAGGADAGKSGG
jgi:preprotein translocase subunit SecG